MAIQSTTGFQTKIELPLANWIRRSSLAHSLVLIGRCLFSSIFILSSFAHFTTSTIAFAANHGVPFAEVLVPFSGLLALFGGISILLGYHARIGALLLILFLIPVTLIMHNFWSITDAMQAQVQQGMFMKNLSMLGGALLIFNFGAGSVSIDEKMH